MNDETPHGVPHERRTAQLAGRLRRSVALLTAGHRRTEVVEVVGDAHSEREAREAVSDLLSIDEEQAAEVVEMPVAAFTRERMQAREEEVARLEDRLADLQKDR